MLSLSHGVYLLVRLEPTCKPDLEAACKSQSPAAKSPAPPTRNLPTNINTNFHAAHLPLAARDRNFSIRRRISY